MYTNLQVSENKFRCASILLLFLFSAFITQAGNSDTLKKKIISTVPDDISHYMFNNIMMNPAYTGISESENFYMHASIDKPMANFFPFYHPQEYTATNDYSFFKKKTNAIGIYFTESKAGPTQTLTPGISYAHCFNLPFSKSETFYHKLRVGISVNYTRDSLDLSKTSWGDMIDPRFGFVYNSWGEVKLPSALHYFGANVGIWYYNPCGYLGFSVKNLNQPNVGLFSVSKVPMDFNLSAGGRIFVNEHFALHPSFNANMTKGYKGKFNSYNPALLAAYNEKYFVGLSYKDMNKITVQAGAMIWKILLNAECSYPVKSDLKYYGSPSFVGGSVRMILNKHTK